MTIPFGIDLGTTNTRMATVDASGNPTMISGPTGEMLIRSVVYFNDDGPVVGMEAANLLLADPSRGAANSKRYMGRNKVLVDLNGKKYLPQDIAKTLLAFAAQNFQAKTGQLATDTAISVPANYNDKQKQLTITAAEEAGLKVICLPSEPAAALLGNGIHKRDDGYYMVIDVGGGTTDVSVANKKGDTLVIVYTDGEAQLGGQDYNNRLEKIAVGLFEERFKVRLDSKTDMMAVQDRMQRIEMAKISLSVKDQASLVISSNGKIHNAVITRKDFEAATADLTEQVLNCAERTLKAAGVTVDQLQGILLVGGPAQTPALIEGVEKRFGRKPTAQCEAHFATAMGCAIAARMEVEKQGRSVQVGETTLPPLKLKMHEVTGHAIGVASLHNKTEIVNTVIVPKGTPIPSELTKAFKLSEPGQTDARIELLQGPDGAKREDCLVLGQFQLENMKPVVDDIHRIDIRLHLDNNGMLTATAEDPLSGVKAELVLSYKTSDGSNPESNLKPAA